MFIAYVAIIGLSITLNSRNAKALPDNYFIEEITCMEAGQITGYGNSCVSGDSRCIPNGCPGC